MKRIAPCPPKLAERRRVVLPKALRSPGVAVALLLAVASVGCVSRAAALNTAVQSYTTAMQTLADLRQQGAISDAQALQVDGYRQTARAALDAWRAAYEAGASTASPAAGFGAAMLALSDVLIQAQGSQGQPTAANGSNTAPPAEVSP
jgi:hypothetical protein